MTSRRSAISQAYPARGRCLAELLNQALQTRPAKQAHWSVRSFAAEADISKDMAHRLFRAASIAPHRSRSFNLYSSWLNQVERWFALITERAIRRNSFTSVRELKQQIELFVQRYNADASPFQWVATADSILQKIERISSTIPACPTSGVHSRKRPFSRDLVPVVGRDARVAAVAERCFLDEFGERPSQSGPVAQPESRHGAFGLT
jgi:hypothetical protein